MRASLDSLRHLAFQVDAPPSQDPYRVVALRGYYANVGYRFGLVMPQHTQPKAELPAGACFFVRLGPESDVFLQVLHARLQPSFPSAPMAPKVALHGARVLVGEPARIGHEPVVLQAHLGLEATAFRIGFDADGRTAAWEMPERNAARLLLLAALGGVQIENIAHELEK
jgi:hypothetical protein